MATATVAEHPDAGALTPRLFAVSARERNTADTWTLTLEPVVGEPPTIAAGQFMMVYAFGIGEVPISVSGAPNRPGPVVADRPSGGSSHGRRVLGRTKGGAWAAGPLRNRLADR